MRIRCPYCGERSLDEFAFHGDAAPLRPDGSSDSDTKRFYEYVFERDNRRGVNEELWQHLAGCRAWLVVKRDVVTHEIFDVAAARDKALARLEANGKRS